MRIPHILICDKCKKDTNRLIGIKNAGNPGKKILKWICEVCYEKVTENNKRK